MFAKVGLPRVTCRRTEILCGVRGDQLRTEPRSERPCEIIYGFSQNSK
jgi:hypothetical protein